MAKAADYRKHAQECVEIAKTVRTSSQRTMLLHIAETWLRLASDAEDDGATKTRKSSRQPLVM